MAGRMLALPVDTPSPFRDIGDIGDTILNSGPKQVSCPLKSTPVDVFPMSYADDLNTDGTAVYLVDDAAIADAFHSIR
jgi:hypothetical protein